jgi:hypothetical protein
MFPGSPATSADYFCLSPEGYSGNRIDKQFVSQTREGLPRLNCPHWRSVFSSVFKEPKLCALPRW